MDFKESFMRNEYVVHTGSEHAADFCDWCVKNNIFIHSATLNSARKAQARGSRDVGFNYNHSCGCVFMEEASYYERFHGFGDLIPWERFLELTGDPPPAEIDLGALLSVVLLSPS